MYSITIPVQKKPNIKWHLVVMSIKFERVFFNVFLPLIVEYFSFFKGILYCELHTYPFFGSKYCTVIEPFLSKITVFARHLIVLSNGKERRWAMSVWYQSERLSFPYISAEFLNLNKS